MTRNVIITGAAGGIGREFASLFARDGYRIIAVDVSADGLAALAGQLARDVPGSSCLTLCMDLAEVDAAQRIADWLRARELDADVLVNNVGFGLFGEHVELDSTRLAQMLAVNNTLMTQLCLLIGAGMKQRRRGRILNVASLAGFAPMPCFAAYSASKSYVISFSVALARELKAHGVQVSCLCPSTTRTGFLETAQGRHQSSQGITRFVSARIATARSVAEAGYRGLRAGRVLVLPTRSLRLQSTLISVVPPAWAAWFVHWQSRRA